MTTIYDNVRRYEREFITKYASIMDFRELGFKAKTNIALKVAHPMGDLLDFLGSHPNINSLYTTDSEYDILAELVFQELRDVDEFLALIKRQFPIEKYFVFNITGDLKREEFMSRQG